MLAEGIYLCPHFTRIYSYYKMKRYINIHNSSLQFIFEFYMPSSDTNEEKAPT